MNASDDDSRRTRGRKVVYSLIVLAGVVLLAEGAARLVTDAAEFERFGQRRRSWIETGMDDFTACLVADPELFWRLAPDRSLPEDSLRPFFGQISNRDGMRGEPVGPRRTGVLRVLALGDSCTFGFGADATGAWPARLERALNEAGRPAEVINAGVPGYASSQGRVLAERLVPRLRPDVVVVTFGWNDSSIWDGRPDHEHRAGVPGVAALLKSSRAWLLLQKLLFSLRRSAGGSDAAMPRVPVDRFAQNLAAIGAVAAAHDAEALFVTWPFRGQVADRSREHTAYQRATLQADGHHLDLLPVFREQLEAASFRDLGHVGPEGYRVVADAVAAKLTELAR